MELRKFGEYQRAVENDFEIQVQTSAHRRRDYFNATAGTVGAVLFCCREKAQPAQSRGRAGADSTPGESRHPISRGLESPALFAERIDRQGACLRATDHHTCRQ